MKAMTRRRLLNKLKRARTKAWFAGHYHRNAGGFDPETGVEVVVTSSCASVLAPVSFETGLAVGAAIEYNQLYRPANRITISHTRIPCVRATSQNGLPLPQSGPPYLGPDESGMRVVKVSADDNGTIDVRHKWRTHGMMKSALKDGSFLSF